jgi:prepilin-type N-terminal cleavage/methylation domain-containing protein
MRTRASHFAAFTLIELLLVLMVIASALAIAAPAMSGWGRNMRLRDAGDQLHATTKWARAQAIANGQVYRLYVDAHAGSYWVSVQDGTEYVPLENEFGGETLLENGQTIKLTDEQDQPIEFVTFYPTGRITPTCNLSISDDRGHVDMICRTPAEGFRMRKPGEVLQP